MAVTSTDDVLAQDIAIPATRSISTTAPLTGGGDLSADRTLALTTSPTGQTPVGVTRSISTTAPLAGGGDLSADRTLTVSTLVGDSGAGGTVGVVPAPAAGDAAAGKYLKADGTWTTPPDTDTVPVDMTGDSGAGGTKGYAPAPAAGDAAAGKYLKADGTWTTPPDTDTVPVAMVGDSGAGGTAGYVPAPAAGDAAARKYLGAGGTWSAVTQQTDGAHGEFAATSYVTEEITLSTSGSTTDSTANLLPANAIILAVVAYVTQTITTATDWQLGDASTAGRFTAANSTLIAGTTDIGLLHMQGGISTDATGPVQTSAAKLRITTSGTPAAGKVRVTVFYTRFSAPSS